MDFVKMHGAGNDYIFLDLAAPDEQRDFSALARRMSDRHFGIGGDGLVLILPSSAADARMRMFNADGSEAGMCGNAVRCVAKYLFDRGRAGRVLTIETAAGPRRITVAPDSAGKRAVGATVDMGEPTFRSDLIPMAGPPRQVLDEEITAGEHKFRVTGVSVGNPHCVVFVPDLPAVPLGDWGPRIEHHGAFPERTNVEFVAVRDETHLAVKVWERGSGETMACGTGACASLAAAAMLGRTGRRAEVTLPGGALQVEWHADGRLYLTGPTVEAFSGRWADDL